jgi:hypothetical protein
LAGLAAGAISDRCERVRADVSLAA